jgi:alpha-L-rhamnosidase
MGESYDARLRGRESFAPSAPHEGEGPVNVGAEVQPILQAHPGEPVREFAELTPRHVTEPAPGVYVFNFGRNIAGMVRLTVRGSTGQRITLRYAERLNPDGTIYTDNLRGARAIDTYVCSGGGIETWQPRFTFHGFQYVELTGVRERPAADALTGLAVSSATEGAGEFSCSSDLLNTLAGNILWTQRANFIDGPTDCPQRDERLGWTGDAQVYCRSACLNADVQAFFHKWLTDLSDAQRADGQFPMVAPLKIAGDDGGPGWADAGVVCPWTIYDVYGDTALLARQYEGMRRLVEFSRSRCTPDLLPPSQFHCFGDWLNIDAETPHEILYMASFARITDLTARTAEVLRREEDARAYRDLYGRIRSSFVRAYVDGAGRIRGDTQTAYALAITYGLLEGERLRRASEHLVHDIEKRGWKLSTGFVGTKELMFALHRIGRTDVAHRLLLNETFPSWGFTIRNGATSIWERWDGWTPEKGFQDPGMNSFAHYAFGAVYEWVVEVVGGIRCDEPGYRRVTIDPDPGPVLTGARTRYRSVRGVLATDWSKEKGRFMLRVEVPMNVLATVVCRNGSGAILESGRPAAGSPGVRPLGTNANGNSLFEVGGGTYLFEYPLQQ